MIPKTGEKNIDTIVVLGILVLILIILTKLGKFFAHPLDVIGETIGITPETPDFNPATLPIDETKLNYPINQYDIWAQVLEDAIWSGWGENEEEIKEVMYQINSDADYYALVKAYGKRTSLLGLSGGTLPSELHRLTPELVSGFNDHFIGWGMKSRI
jgi:LPXTG-motif cell wall-anchored protein